jgi:hypothetical protein
MAILEEGDEKAIFRGRRYVRIADYRFQIAPKFKTLERKLTLSSREEGHELNGVAVLERDWRRIAMMGAGFRDADILVIFVPMEQSEEWNITEEQARRWPCALSYEVNEQTGRLQRWRLVLYNLPAITITKIAEVAMLPWVLNLTLEVYLGGLYMLAGQVSEDGWPRGKLAYLLPIGHWNGKTPRVFGFASWLEVDQKKVMWPRKN